MKRSRHAMVVTLLLLLCAAPVPAAVLTADALLADLGYTADQIADVKAGKIATEKPPAANERDLTAAFVFLVDATPAELLESLLDGLLMEVDPATIASERLTGAGTLDEMARLTLSPDTDKRVKRYLRASGGDDLNLSAEEIAALQKLGTSAAATAVEAQVRAALLARYEAYSARGLDGIAPYDRGGGSVRSVADELRAFLGASKALQQHAPAAYAAMAGYPNEQPAGTKESIRWTHFKAHGVPTLALVHALAVPDGNAFVVMQRQFYVSEGYNCEQAVAAFLPVQRGTVVVYANHTSTDQVAGFGGGAKRSIGSKMLSSQLTELFEKVRNKAK